MPALGRWRLARRGSGFAPVQEQVALGEEPGAVDLGEDVAVAGRANHDHALAVDGVEVVRDRVAEAGGAITVERDRALAVEVRGRLVLTEVLKDGRQPVPPVDDVARFRALSAQVNREAGIWGEERLLAFRVAGVGAGGVRV